MAETDRKQTGQTIATLRAIEGGAPAGNGEDEAPRRPRSLRPLLMLQPYLTAHPRMLAAMAAAIVVSAGAMLTVPIAVRGMIDNGFSGQDAAVINRTFGALLVVAAVLALASSARFYCVNWLGERVVASIRRDVFAHLTRLSPAFYETQRTGEILSRLAADTTQIKSSSGSVISQALRNLMMLAGALTMMIVTSPKLSALLLVAIPLVVLPLMAYGRSVRQLARRAQDTLAEATAYAGENLSAIKTLQAATNERGVLARFGKAIDISLEAAIARMRARAGLTAIVIFLTFAGVVGVLWYGASEVVSARMTGGTLSQFVLYALMLAGAIAELAEVWGELQQAAGATERLAELLAVTPQIVSPERPVPLPLPPRGEIALDKVSFAYPGRDDLPALHNVTLAVRPGETVALVGPSGAGKSTLFNLLLRFYDPTAGEVLIDGVRAREADLGELRRRFALVPQEIALFADTVAENIRYGATEAGEADIEEAARAAYAHEFIGELPQGYATRLGERGVTLSGGQRQRIAIARAILRQAPILLLDEATSALDAESERLVQQALARLSQGRTTLVIAHRLATVERADRILVMDEGRIVEEGTHGELVRRGGLYSRLAALQFKAEAAE